MISKLWVEKWRPESLGGYIFQNENHKKTLEKFIKNKEIPNLLLSGMQGSGKTTIAKILMSELGIDDADVIIINGSDNNSVDYIRDTISSFAGSFAMGAFKIVFIDEADYVTGNAQAALRVLMEESSDNCRFILACNHENKIIPALKSRVQHLHFKAANKDDIMIRIGEILATEGVEFDIDLLDKYVSAGYPDIRKTINLVEQNTFAGKLHDLKGASDSTDYKFKMIELLQSNNLKELRKLVCSSVSKEEMEDVYRFLYDNLHTCERFQYEDKYEMGVVTIANYLYKHAMVADPEINMAAMFIELGRI